ncbi:MAG TPA: hypothetical protein DHN29_21605 [Cytophagales bacterium]|nr:hypothetical protein [Cytophagales bacterium]|tara:strand:+ start:3865 stop:4206 length:342 start_codon:yes stop_codon:yes gene_type:complete
MADVLLISSDGYGKIISSDQFKIQKRGGRGVRGMGLTDEGLGTYLAVILTVDKSHQSVLIATNEGQVIHIPLESVSRQGRNASGVRLMDLSDSSDSVSVATLLFSNEAKTFPL